ncbi:MAG: RNA pseudouridine synthase [Treponema sp.]|nr:RNA pseudouridine synthase [Treponema sp.]
MNAIPIIYENNEIYVINKPQGLAVQGGKNIKSSVDTVLPAITGSPCYLVHRLDQETSGLMVVAKNPKAAGKWTNLINQKEVTKEYTALCIGNPKNRKGKITASINDKGIQKQAVTFFEAVKTFDAMIPVKDEQGNPVLDDNGEPVTEKACELTLFHLKLGTGRMHQIRIHLAKEGYPIAGDDKHGDFKMNKKLRKMGIRRLCLCSSRLTLASGEVFEVEPDFKNLCAIE